MIIGFNFKKINIEKRNPVTGKVDINNNVSVTHVEESDFPLGKQKQKGVTFQFEFTSKYEPDVGGLLFTGEILYLGDQKTNDEIIKGWQKSKTIPKEIMAEVIDTALTRCNIEALILSRDINLPPPVPLPKVKRDE
ncbi:hypothetical protein HYY72_04255 [Candidatus Woesearchaeota archaeon]|nr:hypothetical protein [Candidatus Woesearchaeota archaeon]